MVESKPQMKHFTAVALDFPKNRVGQAHLAHTLTSALALFFELRIQYQTASTATEMLDIYLNHE